MIFTYRIEKWEELATDLGISKTEEDDIVDTHFKRPKLQRREALNFRKWKELNGPKATYHELIKVLHLHGRVDTAYKVKDFAISKDRKGGSQHSYVIDIQRISS